MSLSGGTGVDIGVARLVGDAGAVTVTTVVGVAVACAFCHVSIPTCATSPSKKAR